MKVALIGATGRVGGWVLEDCLERQKQRQQQDGDDSVHYSVDAVRVLCRNASKLEACPAAHDDRVEIVEGDATDVADVQQLLYGRDGSDAVDVVISTIGSPSKKNLVVKRAAEALVRAIQGQGQGQQHIPRIVWMTTTGVNEATEQAHMYPLWGTKPSKRFFGYGGFGWLQFKVLIPYLIGEELWADMGHSETVLRERDDICAKTVIVRPTNMSPVSEAAVFSDAWRKAGGTNLAYTFCQADDPPPGKWMCRRAIAKALVDLAADDSRDGTAVSLFQGEEGP